MWKTATNNMHTHHTIQRSVRSVFSHEHAFIGLIVFAFFLFITSLVAYAQYSTTYSPPVSTDVTTARTCFDSAQKKLSATDPDPAAYFRYNGDWVCFDTKKKELVEKNKITMQSTCVMYWRPSKTGPVDQSVYVIGQGFSDKTGFANYGAAGYCTNWAYTSWPSQKEMRCWSNGVGEDGNLVWFGWADAQGIRGMPADPGKKISLEAESTICSGIGPGEWKWRTMPEPVHEETPVLKEADHPLDQKNEEHATVQKKKIPLIRLLRERTQ